MPRKPLKPCLYQGCVNTVPSGYCNAHAHFRNPPVRPERPADTRPSAAARGYGRNWKAIRCEVLRKYGIPKEIWQLYDIHHEPPYNPAIEPNHRAYTLTPILHGDHSRETSRARGRGIKSPGPGLETVNAQKTFHSSKMQEGVCNG